MLMLSRWADEYKSRWTDADADADTEQMNISWWTDADAYAEADAYADA